MSMRESKNGSAARKSEECLQLDESMTSEKSRKTTTSSPTRFNRIQEKHELKNLNNCLVAYSDRIMYLETENSKLTQELNSFGEMITRLWSNVKVIFECKLEDLRNALFCEAKQKNHLQIEIMRKNLEVQELKTKLDKTTKELKQAVPYISRFVELSSKYDQTLINNKNLKNANKKLTRELTTKNQNVKDIQKPLEKEILQSVTAENKLQSLKKNFKFKEEVHKQKLDDTSTSRCTEVITGVDGRLFKEYEERLQSELQTLQSQVDKVVQQNKKEIANLFDSKFQHLENELQRKKKGVESEH